MLTDATTATLNALRDSLHDRGIKATGPHPGNPSPEWDYLRLPGGRRVHVQQDDNGYWQVLLYGDARLVISFVWKLQLHPLATPTEILLTGKPYPPPAALRLATHRAGERFTREIRPVWEEDVERPGPASERVE